MGPFFVSGTQPHFSTNSTGFSTVFFVHYSGLTEKSPKKGLFRRFSAKKEARLIGPLCLYQIKFDFSISPLSISTSSPVTERLTAVRYQARSAISAGSAHLPRRVSAFTAA